MAGIRRTLGMAPAQKAAVVTAQLRALLAVIPEDTHAGLRDRALLLVGFAGGFRRSELVALGVQDIAETEDGLRVRVRRSKTDQEAEGREIGIPRGQKPTTDPVRALRAWRRAAGIDSDPLFRPVNRHDTVQDHRLTAEGMDTVGKRPALRSGLATAAAAGGAPEGAIMRQTVHRSVEMVRRCIRAGSLFQENAAVGMPRKSVHAKISANRLVTAIQRSSSGQVTSSETLRGVANRNGIDPGANHRHRGGGLPLCSRSTFVPLLPETSCSRSSRTWESTDTPSRDAASRSTRPHSRVRLNRPT